MHSLMVHVDIIWTERSPRPRVSEVTYVPRSEVREYDWFVILRVCDDRSNKCIYVPLLLEELSFLYEFCGKVGMDKLLGIGIPIIFTKGEASYLGPALASGAYPAAIDLLNLLPNFCEISDAFEKISIFAELLEPEFWDELTSARLFYSPSIYVNFVLRPLFEISSSVREQCPESEIVNTYWNVINLKSMYEKLAFSGESTQKEDIDYNMILKNALDKYLDLKCVSTVNDCIERLKEFLKKNLDISEEIDTIVIHLPLFTLRTVIPEENLLRNEFSKVDIHPAFESIISVALLLGYIIEKETKKRVIILVHTDECEIREGNKVWFVEEWIMEKIHNILFSYGFKDTCINIAVHLWSRMFRDLRGEEVKKLIDRFYEAKICSHANVVNVVIVRDTSKGFLYNLIEALREKGKIFVIYVPEELRIFIEYLPPELRFKSSMPTRGLVLSKNAEFLLNESNEERKFYSKCKDYCKSCSDNDLYRSYCGCFSCLLYLSSILDSMLSICSQSNH